MAYLHQMQRLSDIATLMNKTNFKVHKAIMCSASSVIAAACDNDMKEKDSGVIEHDEYDTDTVERMIAYVYTQTYDVKKVSYLTEHIEDPHAGMTLPDVNDMLVAHARVFAIGDYYDIPKLKDLAVENFLEVSRVGWEVEGFIEVIKEVNKLTSTDHPELRNVLRLIAMEHITELTKKDDFMTQLAGLKDTQDFAADMLRVVVLHHDEERSRLNEDLKTANELAEQVTDRIKRLEDRLAAEIDRAASNGERADANASDARQAIHQLRSLILQLPLQCRNDHCNREFGKLQIEHKGNATPGSFYTDWWIKCAKCNCKLNK
ncbi:hypothetical protein LTR81_000101 [Elasticomyces elasticus]